MNTSARPSRLPAGRESGFTLLEMMISTALILIVVTVTFTFVVQVNKAILSQDAQAERVVQAQLGIWQIQRAARSANYMYAPTTESPYRFKVYTQTNNSDLCVEWWHDEATHTLKSRQWSPEWRTNDIATDWSVVVAGLANNPVLAAADASPVFSLPGGAYGDRLVKVSLQVADSRDGVDTNPVKIVTSFAGRNTQFAYNEGICNDTPPLDGA